MGPGADFEQQFETWLDQEHALLDELLQSVEHMKTALVEGSSVDTILRDKEHLLEKLEKCTAQRQQLLLQHGIPIGRGNLGEDLSAHNCSARVIEKYRAFEQLVHDCEIQNQALGRMAKRREGFVNRALEALGSATAGTSTATSTYSPGGHHADGGPARWLGSA